MRRLAVVTGTRAEYGLLKPVMGAIQAREDVALHTIVCGSHMVSDTWRDIEMDGFAIDAKVEMQRANETGRLHDARALGRGITALADVYEALDPTFVIVLGDRIEAFAAASAAAIGGVRVCHLHGGDRAQGVADESMRHAISKLAHVHAAATTTSADRLIRMGETQPSVHVVGSPAMDTLHHVTPADDAPTILVMHHPVGDDDTTEASTMRAVLNAVADHDVLVMAPNLDPGRQGIVHAIRESKHAMTTHLPRDRFLSLLKGAKVIVGNSSAGLIEAAALKTACVNIGPRQNGRDKPANVIDVDADGPAISRAIQHAMAMDLAQLEHPYGDGHTGQRVAELLATCSLPSLVKMNAY